MLTGKQDIYYQATKDALLKTGFKVMKETDEYIYLDPPKGFDMDAIKDINTALFYYTGIKIKVRKKLVK